MITGFETSGWKMEGSLYNNHLTARAEEGDLRFLFSIQFIKRWFRQLPFFSITLFYRPWENVVHDKKLGVRFENLPPVYETLFDVHDNGSNKVHLVNHDQESFLEIISRITIPMDLAVTVFSKDEELVRVPLAHDSDFLVNYELFRLGRH